MEAEKTQVIGVVVDNNLKAIVYHDMKTREQVFFKVEKMTADEIKDLLNTEAKITKHD